MIFVKGIFMTSALECEGNLNEFLKSFEYQPKLTNYLDKIGDIDFNQEIINEIVLWKVNRYAKLDENIISDINSLRSLEKGQHRKSISLLEKLLTYKGIDIAMASTIFRFKNPKVFQIIDRHAYRAIFNKKIPIYNNTNIKKKIGIYFDYIDELIKICEEKNLDFSTIDRLLYVFDKEINGNL